MIYVSVIFYLIFFFLNLIRPIIIEIWLNISVTVPEYELQIRLYISHMSEVGMVSALSCCVLGFHITKDDIIIAAIGSNDAGEV